jgi:hypothetical protein
MKKLLLILLSAFPLFAQDFQLNDPYPGTTIAVEINVQISNYYPIFGLSEKPYSYEKIIRLKDRNNVYTTYLHFSDSYSSPKYDRRTKVLRLYFPNAYYDYIIQRLEKTDSYIVYREYRDGHTWGEIYFDKYP